MKAVFPSGRLVPSRVLRMSPSIRFIGSSRTRASTPSALLADSSPQMAPVEPLPPSGPKFVGSLTNKELSSFVLLSAMTSSKSLVNLSTKMLPYTPNALVKAFVYPIYCGGESFDEVRETGRKLLNRGIGNMMLSYSVEDAEGSGTPSAEKARLLEDAVAQICRSIDSILVPHYNESARVAGESVQGYVALKPTGLMSGAADILRNHDKPEYAAKWAAFLDVCEEICQYAATHGEGKVAIVFDAEKKALQPGVYAAQRAMMEMFNTNGNMVVIGTVQMYLQDSLQQVQTDFAHAQQNGYLLGLKLVRGAYMHSEPDRNNTVHRSKADTDASYDAGVALLLDSIVADWHTTSLQPSVVGKLIVASHNEESCEIVNKRLTEESPAGLSARDADRVVFGQLMGMADDLSYELATSGRHVVKYVPWGPAKETKEYLVRRLEENGDAARQGGWPYVKAGLRELARRAFQ